MFIGVHVHHSPKPQRTLKFKTRNRIQVKAIPVKTTSAKKQKTHRQNACCCLAVPENLIVI